MNLIIYFIDFTKVYYDKSLEIDIHKII